MSSSYHNSHGDGSNGSAEYSAYTHNIYPHDMTGQLQSHPMTFSTSNGSNHGLDDPTPAHDTYSHLLDGSSPHTHYDPSVPVALSGIFDSASYPNEDRKDLVRAQQQQQQQQPAQEEPNLGATASMSNYFGPNSSQLNQSHSQSQKDMMAQMICFANAYEFASPAPATSSCASPNTLALVPDSPSRVQRTPLFSVPTTFIKELAVRPSAQGRSKSHSVAETFGMMGPPPRPLVRSQTMTNSQFGRMSAPASPQQHSSPNGTSSDSYSASAFVPAPVPQQAPQTTIQRPVKQQAQTGASPQKVDRRPSLPNSLASTFSMNPTRPSSPFDAASRGLPTVPAQFGPSASGTWTSPYATNGFDMVKILSRVASRPNPQLALGPVDLGCSFLVVDARKFDQPIIYASETFARLTGYSSEETLGRNCRFLQAPDAQVVQGEKRKYTDGNAAYHIRRHIVQGKESQASMINYCKGGRPFINLITVIPISWDSDEIAFYVGFQVDLVEQPSAIMDKMKNGSYAIDYRISNIPREMSAPSTETISVDHLEELTGGIHDQPLALASPGISSDPSVSAIADMMDPSKVLDQVDGRGPAGLANESGRKLFNRMLLENCDDFVHVLSLKGALLYVSPSSKQLLEYEPQALVGKSLGSYCHPSDIVSVLRELKEAGSSQNASVDLVFRFRRKNSGYTWIEAHGKLHLEQGKGRKCVILVGRVRHVYKMSWSDLERAGGFGKQEYWSKLTTSGMMLYATPTIGQVLGYRSEDVVGKTLAELSPGEGVAAVMDALAQAAKGVPATARHRLLNMEGVAIDVVTHFYPPRSQTGEESTSAPMFQGSEDSLTVVAQTNSVPSEMAKPAKPSLPSAPSSVARALANFSAHGQRRPSLLVLQPSSGNGSAASSTESSTVSSSSSILSLPSFNMSARGSQDSASTSGTSAGKSTTSFSAITSTYKTLEINSNLSDNIFDELDSVRGTSWQFELHQMRLTNKKLREEKEALVVLQSKKRRREAGQRSDPGKSAKSEIKSCLNCGKTQSAEWRSGPTGPKTLCNACGLRWSKARSQSVSGSKGNEFSPKSLQGSPSCSYPTPDSSGRPSVSPHGTGFSTLSAEEVAKKVKLSAGNELTVPPVPSPSLAPTTAAGHQRPAFNTYHSAYSTG
ncbi:BQ5605_C001g00274 [Microbotryum silenes-dioicae]|uniref:BQ5605_C001g00274 protein n=1 Tax=Microbotryum silenes-dioicae TaxID=796604 RepID=A0A2X0MX99_9BASI|nr:BQ5605_C001g00274 [Microbotryum silenes-dioicae]